MPAKPEERLLITSAAALQDHFSSLSVALAEPETEDSWQRLDRALQKLEQVTKGGGYKFEEYVPLLKGLSGVVCTSLLSDRTRLSGTASDLLNSIAPRLGDRFDALVPSFIPSLLLLCARQNKVAMTRARKTLLLIAKHCRLASLLPFLREASKDKAPGLRTAAVECAAVLVETSEKGRIGKRAAEVENIVKTGATDSNPEVRQLSKRLFQAYMEKWPERVELFTAAFTPTIRRYLALPKTGPVLVPSFAASDSAPEPSSRAGEKEARPARSRDAPSAPLGGVDSPKRTQLAAQLAALRAQKNAAPPPAPNWAQAPSAHAASAALAVRVQPVQMLPKEQMPPLVSRSASSSAALFGASTSSSSRGDFASAAHTYPGAAAAAGVGSGGASSALFSAYAQAFNKPHVRVESANKPATEPQRTRERTRSGRTQMESEVPAAPECREHRTRPETQRTASSGEHAAREQAQHAHAHAHAHATAATAPSELVAERLHALVHDHQAQAHSRAEAASQSAHASPERAAPHASLSASTGGGGARRVTVKASRVQVALPAVAPTAPTLSRQPSASRIVKTLPKSAGALALSAGGAGGALESLSEQVSPTAPPRSAAATAVSAATHVVRDTPMLGASSSTPDVPVAVAGGLLTSEAASTQAVAAPAPAVAPVEVPPPPVVPQTPDVQASLQSSSAAPAPTAVPAPFRPTPKSNTALPSSAAAVVAPAVQPQSTQSAAGFSSSTTSSTSSAVKAKASVTSAKPAVAGSGKTLSSTSKALTGGKKQLLGPSAQLMARGTKPTTLLKASSAAAGSRTASAALAKPTQAAKPSTKPPVASAVAKLAPSSSSAATGTTAAKSRTAAAAAPAGIKAAATNSSTRAPSSSSSARAAPSNKAPPARPVGSRVVSGSGAVSSSVRTAANKGAGVDASKPAAPAAAAQRPATTARFMPTRPASGKVGAAKAAAAAAAAAGAAKTSSTTQVKNKPAAPSAAAAKRASAIAEHKAATAATAPSVAAAVVAVPQPEPVEVQETATATASDVETPQAPQLGDAAAPSESIATPETSVVISAAASAGIASPLPTSASAAEVQQQPSPTSTDFRELRRTLVEALGESANEVPVPVSVAADAQETQESEESESEVHIVEDMLVSPPVPELESKSTTPLEAAPEVIEDEHVEPPRDAAPAEQQRQQHEAATIAVVEPEAEPEVAEKEEAPTLAVEQPQELDADAQELTIEASVLAQADEPLEPACPPAEDTAPMAMDEAVERAASPMPASLQEQEADMIEQGAVHEEAHQAAPVVLAAVEQETHEQRASPTAAEAPAMPEAEQSLSEEAVDEAPAMPEPQAVAAAVEQPELSVVELPSHEHEADAPELLATEPVCEESSVQQLQLDVFAAPSAPASPAGVSAAASPARSVHSAAPQTPPSRSAASSPRRSTRSSAARPTPLRTPLAPVAGASSNIPRASSPLKPRAAASSPLKAPRSLHSSPLKPRSLASSPLKQAFARGDFSAHSLIDENSAAAPSPRCYDDEYESEYDSDALPDDSVDLVRFSASSPTKAAAAAAAAVSTALRLQRRSSVAAAAALDASLTVDTSSSALTADDEHDLPAVTPSPLPLRRSLRHRGSVTLARKPDGRVQLVCGSGMSSDAPGPSSDTVF